MFCQVWGPDDNFLNLCITILLLCKGCFADLFSFKERITEEQKRKCNNNVALLVLQDWFTWYDGYHFRKELYIQGRNFHCPVFIHLLRKQDSLYDWLDYSYWQSALVTP